MEGHSERATIKALPAALHYTCPPDRIPSPLRNDEHVSNKPTRVSVPLDPAFKKPILVRCLSYQRVISNDI